MSGPGARWDRFGWLAMVLVLALADGLPEAGALEPSRSLSQYNSRTWRRVNRLPANAVAAIQQTADGHMWLGTPRGLVDFDGVEFKPLGLPGLNDTRTGVVSCLTPRQAGGLWVGTERGGYGWFDGTKITALPGGFLGGNSPTIRAILELRDGSLFISAQGTVGRRLPSGEEQILSTEIDVLCLQQDTKGRVLIGTVSSGLLVWEKGTLTKLEGPAGQLWGTQMISALTIDRDGVIWVGAANGLHRLAPDFSPLPSIGYGNQPGVLLVDGHGALWIGSMYAGLARYHDGKLSSLTRNDGLASDRILALAESADGSMWVGTEDGLTQLSEVKFPILSQSEGLSGDASMCVAADSAGAVWVGTNYGLTRIADGRGTSFGLKPEDGFPSVYIRRVLAAKNGDIYTMGGNQEINRLQHGRVVRTWQPGFWSQSMVEDATGVVFTIRNKLIRLLNDEMAPYRLANGAEPELGWINQLLVARDSSLWIAANPGVSQIRDGVLTNWTPPGQASEDLNFFNLCEDDSGAIWAARSTGLVRLKDGKVATVDHRQGLHADAVYAIVPDLQGNFWMDSPQGVFRVSQRDLNAVADRTIPHLDCTVFDGSHVIKASEKMDSEYSGCRSADGRIWLTSAKGIILIDPAHLPVNSRPPPIQLLHVRVNGRTYAVDQQPELEPGSRNLEFEYTAIDYQAPERIRYRYRLEGFQQDWTEAGARQTATFTNLPPGTYRFQVQACNADGVWTPEGVRFAFTLPPTITETWWFRPLLLGFALVLIALAWLVWDRRRRRQLAEIRHREELQTQMIESSPVPMILLDDHHLVLHVNAAFTRVFGYLSEELPDLDTWWQLACNDNLTRNFWGGGWKQRLAAAAAAGRSIEPVESTLSHKDKTPRHVVITTSLVGERTLVICSDLTERKQAEDQRRRLEEQLRQGQKLEAVGRLAGGIAHDFNNLLTVIIGNVSQLELDTPATPDTTSTFTHIKNAARRAATLTGQMLSFSRKQPLQVTGVDLSRVVREMTGLLQRLLGDDITLELHAATPAPVRADVSKIEQLVINLALNSRDAMPRGGRLTLTIDPVDVVPDTVSTALPVRPGRCVRLTVSDTGSGIQPEHLPRIFDPFFTTKEVGQGTGLGLATVYGIVEQHQGWIDVASTPDQGTTFRIFLPVDPNPPPPPAPAPVVTPAAESARPATRTAGRCILLVEDDTGVRDYARRILLRQGYTVLEAASGRQALPVWEKNRAQIEILFTDVMMPEGINGLELAQRLHAEKPGLKIVYASGYSADVAGGDFSGRQGRDFLAKPYLPADLLGIIERMTGDL